MSKLPIAILSWLAILALPAFGQAPKAEDLILRIENALAPKNVKATYIFTNHRTDGTVMTYEVQFQMRDADHAHGYFAKPEREKGREVLRLGDDIWSYVPSVGRIVRVADRESFAGGDFSNADVLRVDWSKKYESKILKDLPNQWIVEMTAKTKDAPYARMRLWVDKKTGMPVQQQFFDSRGTLLKRCLYGSVKAFGEITRPARLMMENVITGQKSELQVMTLTAVPSLPDSRFVVDNLGK